MKKRVFFRLAAVLAAMCLLAGCAADAAPDGADFAPAQEQRLVVYTSHKKEVWWPIVKEFEERTGIWVDVVTGGTNELLERISWEADAPCADVMFGGGVESLEAYSEYFTPYLCADTADIAPQYRTSDGLWTPFSALPIVLIYNPKLVERTELTSWQDLLRPEFCGRIAFADPAVSGSENLSGKLLSSSGDILDSVADGTDWVGITLEETALKRIAAGENLRMVYPSDGTSAVPDGSALIRGAQHAENARRFLDFTVSRDVQSLLQDSEFSRRSVRSDIEPPAALVRLEKIPMTAYDISQASSERGAILERFQALLDGEGEK